MADHSSVLLKDPPQTPFVLPEHTILKMMGVRVPTKEELRQMVIKEEEIRMSKEYVDECTHVADEVNGWLRVNERIQYEIVESFGFVDEMERDIAVNALRRATIDYPDLPKPVYVRNNKARKGELSVDDIAPLFDVYDMDKVKHNMSELIDSKPTLIIGSSHT